MSINPDFNRSWGQPKLAEMAILVSMKLIGSLTSPYVRKVRIVFLEKKVDVDLELENVWAADTKIALNNPLGKVPCLILDDGEAIYDSRVIAEYVDTLSPVGKLIPAGSRERASLAAAALSNNTQLLPPPFSFRIPFSNREEQSLNFDPHYWISLK